MEVLIILLVLILLIILILFLPISFQVKLNYENKFNSELEISGKKIPKKEKGQKSNNLDFIETIKIVFLQKSKIWKLIKYVLKKSRVKNFSLKIVVASDDAAQTAINYGTVCSVLYPAIVYLQDTININADDICVLYDYNSTSPTLNLIIKTKISVIHLISVFLKLYPIFKNLRKGNEQK